MNHVVAAAAGLVLDQPSFFSTLLKKFILPPTYPKWRGGGDFSLVLLTLSALGGWVKLTRTFF